MTARRDDVVEAIQSLETEGRRVTPAAVVEAARDLASPLHSFFEWDDAKSAQRDRLHTARKLIVSVEMRITYGKVEIQAPVYTRDPDRPPNQQGYRHVLAIRSEEEAAHEALVAEILRVRSILDRARTLAIVLDRTEELADLEREVAAFVASLAKTQPEEDRPQA